MYLKSLELQGFKSFPDKVKLDFGKGITAVVGPNGSGKSNIGDAVRWVLGEQSSKTLRGAKMEDVIFAGTQLRKPVGFASVTLNIVNDKGLLNIDAPEVSVTRKLYRSGESEYIINGSQVRLKDVTELFMDTGLGKDGYSIIGQGRVAEIVSSKSNERRDIFEEAAGISKFRYKKAEAQRRLTQAEDNILRLTDIISELESRVEPLRKQSEKAAQFIELSDEKKSLEITVWMHELDELRTRLNELGEKVLINATEYNNTETDIERLEEEYRIVYKDIAAGNIRIENLNNAVLEEERSNTAIHSDIAVFKNDIEHCRKAIEDLEKQMESAKLSDSENRRLTEEKLEEIKRIEADILTTDREYSDAEREFAEAVGQQDGFEKEFSGHSEQLNKMYIRQSELNITVNTSDNMIKEAEERLSVKLPEAYKKFLMEFGFGGLDGIETLGVAKNGRMVFVDTTLELRASGMPKNLIAIEDCDEWFYCIENESQQVVSWSIEDGNDYRESYSDFEAYLQDRANDAIDNL